MEVTPRLLTRHPSGDERLHIRQSGDERNYSENQSEKCDDPPTRENLRAYSP